MEHVDTTAHGLAPKLNAIITKKGKVIFSISCKNDYPIYFRMKPKQFKSFLNEQYNYYSFKRGLSYSNMSVMSVDVADNGYSKVLIYHHDGESMTRERVIIVDTRVLRYLVKTINKKLENKNKC